jgi:hypothetical protein
MANLPKARPSPAGMRYLRTLAARAAEGAPQPTANVLAMQRGAGSRPQQYDQVAQGMNDLYRWAQVHGPARDAGYDITGLATRAGETDATMTRMSLDELLARKYGDAWPEVRESMLAAEAHPSIMYPGAKSQQEFLENPFYVLMARGPGASSGQMANAITLSPDQAAKGHVDIRRIAGHELGHTLSQLSSYSGHRPLLEPKSMMDELAKDYPSLAAREKILPQFAKRLSYLSDPHEIAANLNQMRGLHYGVTGDALLKPEDRIRFIRELSEAPIRDPGEPSMFPDAMFPDDPTMKYGPRAGEPADGFNFIEQTLRQTLPRLKPNARKAVESIFNKGAANAPMEPGYV